MDPSITDVASYLAAQIPTGAEREEDAVQEWRQTLYNAKKTRAMGVVTSMVARESDDPWARELCRDLARNKD